MHIVCLIHKSRATQVVLQNNILGSIEHNLDVGGVCGASHVVVNLLVELLVSSQEELQEKVPGRLISGLEAGVAKLCLGCSNLYKWTLESLVAFLASAVHAHWNGLEFFTEEVVLVEEENHARILKVLEVAHLVKEEDSFVHAVHLVVLIQELVVLGYRNNENDSSNRIEAVNPLFSLVALATNIIHDKFDPVNLVGFLDDT